MCYSRNSTILILLFSVLMGLSVACSRRTSDDKITKDIQEKVAQDPETKDSQVTVAAKDGKVTLTGKVKSANAQKRLEQIASEEPGGTGLDDQTVVDPEMTQVAPTMAAAPPPVERPKPQPIVVPSGTVLTVRTGQELSSKTSHAGQTFLATLAQPISVQGRPALSTGATISGTVVSAKAKGKIKGEGELSLALTSISVEKARGPLSRPAEEQPEEH